jgi:hypothetical protein
MLSIAVLFYDDVQEAVDLVQEVSRCAGAHIDHERILVGLDPTLLAEETARSLVPADCRLIVCPEYRGIPYGKNLALHACAGDLLLFVFPGLRPMPESVRELLTAFNRDPSVGGACGRWVDKRGRVEKGYNVRQFPTRLALLFDVLFVNKVASWNPVTRAYKMHDYDYSTSSEVDHANDAHFMVRVDLMRALGGFSEHYRVGWFDQIEACRAIRSAGRVTKFVPGAGFVSSGRPPLVNRLVATEYREYYGDELRFVESEFGRATATVFRGGLAAGMIVRIVFVYLVPGAVRRACLRSYRSYVDEAYVLSMLRSYKEVLRLALGRSH